MEVQITQPTAGLDIFLPTSPVGQQFQRNSNDALTVTVKNNGDNPLSIYAITVSLNAVETDFYIAEYGATVNVGQERDFGPKSIPDIISALNKKANLAITSLASGVVIISSSLGKDTYPI